MLDLQKYLGKAATDPGFKAKLLKNANQAVKDEFGEDLPYKLKCKEKLAFEVEAMDEMSDADANSVAGGDGEGKVQDFDPAPLLSHHFKTENVCLAPAPPIMNDSDLENVAGGDDEGKVQDFDPAPLLSHHFKTENVCLAPAPPIMNDSDLESVAGGGEGSELKEKASNAKKWMKQFKSNPNYTYPQPDPSNPSSNPSSEPRNPAGPVYGAKPPARYW